MKVMTLSDVQSDLLRHLQLAYDDEIIITLNGKPAGYLGGFEDEDDLIDYLMLRDPALQEQLQRALKDQQEGNTISMEEFDAKYPIENDIEVSSETNGKA